MELVSGLDRNRQTIRVGQIVLLATLLSLVPVLVIAINDGQWQWYALSGVLGVALVLEVIGLYRVQNDQAPSGAVLILSSIIAVILSTSFLFVGIGVPMGLLSVFLVWQIANVSLPAGQASQAVFWGVVFTVITILIDLFGPAARLEIPQLVRVLNISGLLIIALFGALVLRNYRHYAVQTKLVSIALFIILLIVSTITVLTGRAIENTLTAEIGRDLQVVAQAQAFAVSELLGRQVNALQVLALNDALQTAVLSQNTERTAETAVQQLLALDRQWQAANDEDDLVRSRQENEAAQTLQQFRASFGHHASMILTDKHGGLVAATTRPEAFYLANEPWWELAHAAEPGGAYISNPLSSEAQETPSLVVALPLYDIKTDEFVGVLQTVYGLEELVDLLGESRQMGEFGEVNLIVGAEKLAFDNGRFALAPLTIETAVLDQLRAAADGFVRTTYAGEPQFLSMAPVNTLTHVAAVDALDWWVLVNQPEREALAPLITQQRINTLLGILLAISGGLIAAYAGRGLSEPLARLTETAVRVRNGDLSARATVEANDEIGILAETFNSMTSQLQGSLQNLDFRVRERTRALEVAASIGRRIATILDQDELIAAVVDQVQKAFNYYHVHIYILDKTTNQLKMVNGTGQAGRAMRKFGHFINLGEGLVGRAAATNITILTPDVTRDSRWVPNKWLPETKSELAVPIATEQEVLGVLDVQRTNIGSLTEADANVLQLVANQVAIALQNSRLYALTQQRADRQGRINRIGQQIQSTDTIEEAMQVAVRELGRALEMDYARVHLQIQPSRIAGTGALVDGSERQDELAGKAG